MPSARGQTWKLEAHYRADPPPITALETTTDRVWLSTTCVCERFTLRGVPARAVDVIIDARLLDGAPRDAAMTAIASIGRKAGRYSGEWRDRLTFRLYRNAEAPVCDWAQLEIDDQAPGVTEVTFRAGDGSDLVRRPYPRLRWEWSSEDPASGCVWWHANRHFGFLVAHYGKEVDALAKSYQIPANATVAFVNREVERALYRLARDLGWRKMTLRERERVWGKEEAKSRPQWHRQSEVAALLERQGPATWCDGYGTTGTSQASRRAARHEGGTLAPIPEPDDDMDVEIIKRYSGDDWDDDEASP